MEWLSSAIAAASQIGVSAINNVAANKRTEMNANAQLEVAKINSELQEKIAKIESKSNESENSNTSIVVVVALAVVVIGFFIYRQKTK